MLMPKYPNIMINLTECDGNAFVILASCLRAARKAQLSDKEIEIFVKEAMSGDYEHLLQTAILWFTCE